MNIVLMLLVGAGALELLLYLIKQPRVRMVLAVFALLIGSFGAGALVMSWFNVWTVLFAALCMYHVVNVLRVVQRRMHEHYLWFATRRTGLLLFGMQAVVLACWWAWEVLRPTGHVVWTVVGLAQVIVAALLLLSVRRNITRMSWPGKQHHYTDAELPTVTVAIPARNETEDLQQCLQTVIASDYPKLEIIVLDDCSQMRRTPEIIKDFAHDGVRFIQGRDPADTWLPKNHAYRRLAEEASGAYLLFCGVDIQFEKHTIRELVTVMLERNKTMLSVLPLRRHDAYGRLSLVQAMRYWWELVPPRRLFKRPPVISSCWLITADALHKAGGFGAARRTILPEAYFARMTAKQDGYSFLRASADLGVASVKRVQQQRDTAIRMRYPQLHRRPENVALLSIAEALFLLAPFVLTILGFWVSIGIVAHACAFVATVLLVICYQMVVLGTHVNTWWFSFVGMPLMVVNDLAMLHYSMWKYEFSEVLWKGRNVCVPVMHVVPHLPEV